MDPHTRTRLEVKGYTSAAFWGWVCSTIWFAGIWGIAALLVSLSDVVTSAGVLAVDGIVLFVLWTLFWLRTWARWTAEASARHAYNEGVSLVELEESRSTAAWWAIQGQPKAKQIRHTRRRVGNGAVL